MKDYLHISLSVMILVMSGCSNEQLAEVNKIKTVDATESGIQVLMKLMKQHKVVGKIITEKKVIFIKKYC